MLQECYQNGYKMQGVKQKTPLSGVCAAHILCLLLDNNFTKMVCLYVIVVSPFPYFIESK